MALHTSTSFHMDNTDSAPATPNSPRTIQESDVSVPANQHISFSPQVIVRATIHIDDYSDDEMAACWYDRQELKAIRMGVRTTLVLMETKNQILDCERLCSRGLESYTTEGTSMKQYIREEARYAVLDEQYLQFGEEGRIYDSEVIADLYFAKTRSSQAMARTMGRGDAAWVRHQNDRTQKKSSAPAPIKAGIILPTRSPLKLRRVSSSAA